MTVAIICTALLGVLLFGLGMVVSFSRGDQMYGFTPEPDNPLYKRIRAHGNTTEYAPFLAVLFLATAAHDPAAWVLWCIGLATLSRYLLVVGLLVGNLDKPHPLRFAGALGTYLTGLALSVNLALSI